MSFLHIYGQNDNHNPVHIVGTRDELLKLMIAIKKGLYFPWQTESMASDGEGYYINVIALDEPVYDKRNLPPPYSGGWGSTRYHNKSDWDLYGLWKTIRRYFGMSS
jgi:hypothetical protein